MLKDVARIILEVFCFTTECPVRLFALSLKPEITDLMHFGPAKAGTIEQAQDAGIPGPSHGVLVVEAAAE